MAFLVKALFRWTECSKNADISVLSNFLTIFVNFFLDIEIFYQVLSTCQISDQLDHSSRHYRGEQNLTTPPPSRPYQSAKSPACLGLRDSKVRAAKDHSKKQYRLLTFWPLRWKLEIAIWTSLDTPSQV